VVVDHADHDGGLLFGRKFLDPFDYSVLNFKKRMGIQKLTFFKKSFL
jgi:sensor domain CHASE-containing protein